MSAAPWADRMGEPPPFSRWWLEERRLQILTTHTTSVQALERYADLPVPPYRRGRPTVSVSVPPPPPAVEARPTRLSRRSRLRTPTVLATAALLGWFAPGLWTDPSPAIALAAAAAAVAAAASLVLLPARIRQARLRRALPSEVEQPQARPAPTTRVLVPNMQSEERHAVHRAQAREALQQHTYLWVVTFRHSRVLVGLLDGAGLPEELTEALGRVEDPFRPCHGATEALKEVADGGRTRHGLAASILMLLEDYHPWPLWSRFQQIEEDLDLRRGTGSEGYG